MLGYTQNILKYLHTVSALVLNVVYSKYILYAPQLFIVSVENAVVYRYKSALPVVRIYYLRLEIDDLEHFKNGTGEESISFRIVIITVKSEITLEIILVIKKIICNIIYLCREKSAILISPAYRHRKICNIRHLITPLLFYRIHIERYYNASLMAFFNERFGK